MFSRLLVAVLCCALTCASTKMHAQTATPPKNVAQSQEAKPTNRASTPNKTKGKLKKTRQVVATPPPPPPPPPTPEQMPAVAPEVIYSGGLLTIRAQNSTMNDVLAAVRRVTGASIEKPPMGGSDRVVATIGPGQPKDVLESLFNGSRYDYIILGSSTRPGGVERVILSTRSNSGSPSAVASNATTQGQGSVQAPPETDQDEPETDSEDMTVPEREPSQPEQEQQQPQQQQPPQAPGQPQQEQQAGPPDQQNPNQQQGQQPRVKSPEELLRELQQMQKQQQSPEQNQQPPEQNQQPPDQNQQEQTPPQQ